MRRLASRVSACGRRLRGGRRPLPRQARRARGPGGRRTRPLDRLGSARLRGGADQRAGPAVRARLREGRRRVPGAFDRAADERRDARVLRRRGVRVRRRRDRPARAPARRHRARSCGPDARRRLRLPGRGADPDRGRADPDRQPDADGRADRRADHAARTGWRDHEQRLRRRMDRRRAPGRSSAYDDRRLRGRRSGLRPRRRRQRRVSLQVGSLPRGHRSRARRLQRRGRPQVLHPAEPATGRRQAPRRAERHGAHHRGQQPRRPPARRRGENTFTFAPPIVLEPTRQLHDPGDDPGRTPRPRAPHRTLPRAHRRRHGERTTGDDDRDSPLLGCVAPNQ